MQLITNQTFGGERSLYKLSDAKLDHVTILAGDSPIKHGTNLTLTNCDIEGKYPLWINTNTVVDNCLLKVTARSGLWYLKNFKVTNTRFECPKSFRDSDGIEIRDCTFTDAQETLWSCRNVLVEKSSFDKGDYLLAHSSDIRLKNIKLNGNYLGQVLGGQSSRWLLIPIGMLIGYFIVRAEPAVYVLNKQVEEVTDGAISAGTMGAALSAGVALSVGLAMVRVLTGISILWFLIPGYLFAISISFVVPKLYTAIAFDAGGVASGPMTATFLLPLAQGACIAVGGNIVTDAFGVVAMVAMTPLITVQLMGLVAQLKTRKARSAQPLLDTAALLAELPDDAIIEL
jgi:hypothetical protein